MRGKCWASIGANVTTPGRKRAGAQIVEQPIEGITIFNDVDLYPAETEIGFSREPLSPEEKNLRTVGFGLHGESFLDAGMHHLECRFDYERLREQLSAAHIKTMAPFSDSTFLKQAFTQGERWAVRPERITRLRTRDLLTDEQAQKFAHEGGDRKSPRKPAMQRRLQGL